VRIPQLPSRVVFATLSLLLAFVLTQAAAAQRSAASANVTDHQSSSLTKSPTVSESDRTHREFWDETNILLFAGVAIGRGLDFASTQQFRHYRRQELLLTNGIVDNKPLFLTVEVSGAAASIAISYWLHRTGHHRIERLVSIAHFGAGVGGATHNYILRSLPPKSPRPR